VAWSNSNELLVGRRVGGGSLGELQITSYKPRSGVRGCDINLRRADEKMPRRPWSPMSFSFSTGDGGTIYG